MSARTKWTPLAAIAVAYAGIWVGFWVMSLLSTPEYQHATYLHIGLIALTWSLLALACLAVSRISLRRASSQLDPSLRTTTTVLTVPIVIAVVVGLLISVWSLNTYRSGIADYDAAVQRCGHPPVLAWSGYWGHYLPPEDSDYDRLKYSADDPLINGPLIFYCSTAEAESNGIHRFAGTG